MADSGTPRYDMFGDVRSSQVAEMSARRHQQVLKMQQEHEQRVLLLQQAHQQELLEVSQAHQQELLTVKHTHQHELPRRGPMHQREPVESSRSHQHTQRRTMHRSNGRNSKHARLSSSAVSDLRGEDDRVWGDLDDLKEQLEHLHEQYEQLQHQHAQYQLLFGDKLVQVLTGNIDAELRKMVLEGHMQSPGIAIPQPDSAGQSDKRTTDPLSQEQRGPRPGRRTE